CGGFVSREPAAVTCRLCGWWTRVLDADHEARLRQRTLDWYLRPRSIECLSPWNASEDGWWPSAAVRLPMLRLEPDGSPSPRSTSTRRDAITPRRERHAPPSEPVFAVPIVEPPSLPRVKPFLNDVLRAPELQRKARARALVDAVWTHPGEAQRKSYVT